MPTIYYIRHGQTEWNEQGRLQGAQDSPLNELGHRQSVHAGCILSDLLARDGRHAASLAFVASPLGRALQTMELVRGVLKLPLSGYAIDGRLRELGYGEWEGATLAEAQAKDPELFAQRQLDKWTFVPPEGESYVSLQERVTTWYRDMKADSVVVAHGGTARALMAALGLLAPEMAADWTVAQGGVYVFSGGGVKEYS